MRGRGGGKKMSRQEDIDRITAILWGVECDAKKMAEVLEKHTYSRKAKDAEILMLQQELTELKALKQSQGKVLTVEEIRIIVREVIDDEYERYGWDMRYTLENCLAVAICKAQKEEI